MDEDERRERPSETAARAAIEQWLDEHAPGFPDYTMVEDGEGCWAFYVADQDTTSYLHADMDIEWYGTGWPERYAYDERGGCWSARKEGDAFIPAAALARARTVKDAVRAALRTGHVLAAVDGIAGSADYRRFRPSNTGWALETAREATEAFFGSGGTRAAGKVVEARNEATEEISDLVDDLKRTRPFGRLCKAVTEAVVERFPAAVPGEVSAMAAAAVADEIGTAIVSADASSPIDALRGAEVTVCYVPGLGSAKGLEDTMTSFWTKESSCLTVRPDAAFMRFLKLAGVGVADWIEAVHAHAGERVDEDGPEPWQVERAAAWRDASRLHEAPEGQAIVKLPRIVEAVDACPFGFTPLIAFNADAGHICSRDWNTSLSVKGGVLGLHDFVNGSGDPLRFERKMAIAASPREMMVAEARPCDFEEVHGFVRSSFRSRVSDEPAPETQPSRPAFR